MRNIVRRVTQVHFVAATLAFIVAHRRSVTVASIVPSSMALMTLPSYATGSSDLTGGAGSTFFTTITSYFTGDVLPAVLTLLALTVGVSMLISWGRKAAKSK